LLQLGFRGLQPDHDSAHPWFLWVLCRWGIGIAVHDLVLLMKFR
jgi:hypothetical protein